MKVVQCFLLCLIFSTIGFSQFSAANFQFKGKFDFENPSEQIIAYDLFDNNAKLRLIGKNTVQIWDVKNNKVLESRKHGIEDLSAEHFGGISPDRTKLLVLGFEKKNDIKDAPKIIVPAKVYEIETGKLLAVLEKAGKFVKSAVWSKDGSILVTADNNLLTPSGMALHKDETQIGFWDGESLKLRSSVNIKDITWYYLSDNGENFFTTSVPEKKVLFIPFVNGMANAINIWDTRTAKNDKNLSVGDENFHTYTYKMMPSPDGKYFALVSKNKETDTEHRVMVWKVGGGEMPEYTIQANPKIRESTIKYSPDGKYFALDSGKNTQIYEVETGKLVNELIGYNLPSLWVNDNQTVLYYSSGLLKGVQVSNGATVFEQPLIYITETTETLSGTKNVFGNYDKESTTTTIDSTAVKPSPDGKHFLTYSNAALDVFNAASGQKLQNIVESPPTIEKKKKVLGITIFKIKIYPPTTIKSAEWSEDSRIIIISNAGENSLSIWEIKN
ncbi:hypothetical protein BH10ACI1_BH10ACI1_10800 [soil metagenome]